MNSKIALTKCAQMQNKQKFYNINDCLENNYTKRINFDYAHCNCQQAGTIENETTKYLKRFYVKAQDKYQETLHN